MAVYTAVIDWERGEQPFLDGKYSRVHRIRFDGGHEMEGSASPHVVRPPMSSEAAVDPEEMFVASLSSCHMLTFVDMARRAGLLVDRYLDHAEGVMRKVAEGRFAVTEVTLRPEVSFGGAAPSAEDFERLHNEAHEACFISNSVKTEVRVEPRMQGGPDA